MRDLQGCYNAAKKRFDEDEDFRKRSQLQVQALQSGNPQSMQAWQKICEVSRQKFEKIYDRLDVTLEEYSDMIPGVVQELEDLGICVESDGAKCVFIPGVGQIPLMAVKSDGGYGYDSTDLAACEEILALGPAWERPPPPILEPTVDEVFWLPVPHLLSEPMWDYTMENPPPTDSIKSSSKACLFIFPVFFHQGVL